VRDNPGNYEDLPGDRSHGYRLSFSLSRTRPSNIEGSRELTALYIAGVLMTAIMQHEGIF
jgi:hypothetical protein